MRRSRLWIAVLGLVIGGSAALSATLPWNQQGVKMRKGASGKFDFFAAMGCWDPQHQAAFMEWIQNPFWP